MPNLPIALQMYTVRDDAAKDFAGTIAEVAKIGFAGVELAGRGSLSVMELKSLLDNHHLQVCGSHVALDALEKDVAKVIEENLALGNPYVIVPYLGNEHRGSADAYKKVAASLNKFGETVRAHGLTLGYHNHDFEFKTLDNGQTGMDILLGETDPALVKAEVDTYWVLVAGLDPVAFIQKHSGRVPLLHIKDRDKTDGSFAEVGTGDLPLDALVAAAPGVGAQWLIVEQDVCKRPPLEAVKISYDNMKARGYA